MFFHPRPVIKSASANEVGLPECYVRPCAGRYAAMVEKPDFAETDDARRHAKARLSYILSSGLLEYQREYERRVRHFPDDFRKALVDKDGTIITRPVSRTESEILRYSCAIPAFPSIDILSSIEMQGLADMFEGWAQSDLTDCVNVARLHGWADGF